MFGCGRNDWPSNPQKEFQNYVSKYIAEKELLQQKLDKLNEQANNEEGKEQVSMQVDNEEIKEVVHIQNENDEN